jgi:hypothetical protein
MMVTASWMTVSVFSPRKSIFNMPAFSRQFMSYWVTMTLSPFPPEPLVLWVQMGTYSSSGPGAITTPAACTLEWRESPSSVDE